MFQQHNKEVDGKQGIDPAPSHTVWIQIHCSTSKCGEQAGGCLFYRLIMEKYVTQARVAAQPAV
jgi:hypothetical protein